MHWLCPLWQVLGFGFGFSAFEEEDRRRDAKTTRKKEETWCQCYTQEFYCKIFGFNLKSIVWVTAYRWKRNCTHFGEILLVESCSWLANLNENLI